MCVNTSHRLLKHSYKGAPQAQAHTLVYYLSNTCMQTHTHTHTHIHTHGFMGLGEVCAL